MHIAPASTGIQPYPAFVNKKSPMATSLAFTGQTDVERLHVLVNRGKSDDDVKIAKILHTNPHVLNSKDPTGNTALITAADKGDEPILDLLLSHGADPTSKNEYGDTALMRAAKSGNLKISKKLINYLKQNNRPFRKVVNEFGNTALHQAAESGNYELVKLLLDNGFDPGHKNYQKELPYYIASRHNFFDSSDLLLRLIDRPTSPEWDEPTDPDYRQNRIPTFLPLVRKHQIIATKDSNVDSDLAKTESIAAAPSLSKEEDLMSPAQRAFALFMDGKSLLGTEPQQAKEIMSSNDVLEELVMNLVVDASEDDKKKTQIEKGLCYQYFNSSGAVQKFWHRVAQKAFEKSPKELAKVYPETQKLLEITYPNPELKTPSSKQQLGFPGVAGMDELKKDLELEIINPWKDDADPDVIIEKPNGCLFFGPSRTGKTHMAKALAHELGYAPDEIIHVNARDLIEPDQGKSMQNIGRLFDDAKSQPNGAVIHIDEIDALTPKRKDVQTHHAEMPQIVSQFVTEMDEVGKQGVFMIGTTNHLNVIDNALTEPGRFDFQLPIGLPDQTARKTLFQHFVDQKFHQSSGLKSNQYEDLASQTTDFSAGDIKHTVTRAINRWRGNGKDQPFISYLQQAAKTTKPGNNQEEIEEFRNYISRKGSHDASGK